MSIISICDRCGAVADSKCGRCHVVAYCSVACQRAAWSLHKPSCVTGARPPEVPPDHPEFVAPTPAMQAQAARAARNPASEMQSIMSERFAMFRAGYQGSFTVTARDRALGALPAPSAIPDGTVISIAWRDATSGASGSHEDVVFYSGASLAAELYAVGTGLADSHRILEGGWLYLAGEPELFWSMLMHWRECGSVAPGAAAVMSEASSLDTTWGRELQRYARQMRSASQTGSLARGSSVMMPSRSLAFTLVGGAGRAAAELVPFLSMREVPLHEARPAWWLEAAALWEAALTRAVARGKPPCMFWLTPAGSWHAEGVAGGCVAEHDEELRREVAGVKERMAARHGKAPPRK